MSCIIYTKSTAFSRRTQPVIITPFSIMKCADYPPEALQYAVASAETIITPLSTTINQTAPSASIQMGDLTAKLVNFTNQLDDTLNAGLGQVMNDTATFINYAGGGVFSGSTTLPLPAATEALASSLKTYVTSLSLQQNDWAAQYVDSFRAVPDDSSNVAQITTQSGSSAAVWKSPDTRRSYVLEQIKPTAGVNDSSILEQITTDGWAVLDVLFDGAYNCTATGRSLLSQALNTFSPHPPSCACTVLD